MPSAANRPALPIGPALFSVVVLLCLPLCVIVLASLNQGTAPGDVSFNLSLANYTDLFRDDFYPSLLLKTLILSLLVTAITCVFGFVLAVKLWQCSPRTRLVLMMVIAAPLMISVVARTYGWLLVLGEKGVINTFLIHVGVIDQPLKLIYNDFAVVLGLSHLLVAFPALAIHSSLDKVNSEILEAARIAGAGTWRIFADVLLPMTIPGLVVGATFAFTLAMSAFVTPALMGGDNSMIATLIYQKYVVSFDWTFGAALAVTFLIASLIGTLAIAAALTKPYGPRLAALRRG